MEQRLDANRIAPEGYRAMAGLQRYVSGCGLEPSLMELVKIRASQINGCAFCIAMHVRDAAKAGESHERMHLLATWREAPIYSERERAALAWTEAVTRIADGHVPDGRIRVGAPPLLGEGIGGSHLRGGRDQRLEPARDCVPQDA